MEFEFHINRLTVEAESIEIVRIAAGVTGHELNSHLTVWHSFGQNDAFN